MNIDVSEVLKRKVTRKNISLVVNGSEVFSTNEEIKVSNPISVEGVISLVGSILHFDANIKCDLILQCSRCVESFPHTVDIEVHEEFSNNKEDEDDNIIFIDSDSIDITTVIENNILMALPIKLLCNESCKGLCQNCGANLNISTCNCDNIDIDPRLAHLKDFFTTR
jgi:uncharacterized protein